MNQRLRLVAMTAVLVLISSVALAGWTKVPGALKQISVGSAQHVWGVASNDSIWHWTGTGWEAIAGGLTNIAVGADGTVWGVNSAGSIFRRDGNAWTWIPGNLKQIAVGNEKSVWGVHSGGGIYRWNGTDWEWIPGSLSNIAVGATGTVWGVNGAGQIFQWNGSGWSPIDGTPLAQITVGNDANVWGLKSSGEIFRLRKNWSRTEGMLKQISAASDGTVWGVSSNGDIYRATTSTVLAWPEPLTFEQARAQVVSFEPAPDAAPNTIVGVDATGHLRTLENEHKKYGFRQSIDTLTGESVDEVGNRTLVVHNAAGSPLDTFHAFRGLPSWYDRRIYDQKGELLFTSVVYGERRGVGSLAEDPLPAHAAKLGVLSAFPDWIQINFPAAKTLQQVRLYTLQDNYGTIDPAQNPDLTFSQFGVTDYELQYWNGTVWTTPPGGFVVNNRKVTSRIDLANISTSAIRVVVRNGLYFHSRIVELEALDPSGVNVAAAVQGSITTASSAAYPSSNAIDGNRVGAWWNDATSSDGAAGTGPTTTTVSQAFDYAYTDVQNSFVHIYKMHNNNPPATVQHNEFRVLERERIEMLGKAFEATVYRTRQGVEEWDSYGEGRIKTYDWAGRVTHVTDPYGDIVSVVYNDQGRPKGLFIGDCGYINYTYDGTKLLMKTFANHCNGESYYQIDRTKAARQNVFNRSRQVTRAYLPGHGVVAEWDKATGQASGDGFIVASLNGKPYALIPMQPVTPVYDNSKPIRRIVSLFDELDDPLLVERIEYSLSEFVVQMPTGAAGMLASDHDAAVTFPRWGEWRPAGAASTTGKVASDTSDDESGFVKVADGGGDDQDVEPIIVIIGGIIHVVTNGVISPYLPSGLPSTFLFPPQPPPSGNGPCCPANVVGPPPAPSPSQSGFPNCLAVATTDPYWDSGHQRAIQRLQGKNCKKLFGTLTTPSGTTTNTVPGLSVLQGLSPQDGRTSASGGCLANGHNSCVEKAARAWTAPATSSTAIVLCDKFFATESEDRRAITILHELVHLLRPNDTSENIGILPISKKICQVCGPFPDVDCNSPELTQH